MAYRLKISSEHDLDSPLDAEVIARALLEVLARKGVVELSIRLEDARFDERDEEE